MTPKTVHLPAADGLGSKRRDAKTGVSDPRTAMTADELLMGG
jgi:hypothetical protein